MFRVRFSLAEIFPTVNGLYWTDRTFPYHPSIILIRLKRCRKGRRIASHSSIGPSLPFSILLVRTDMNLLNLSGHHLIYLARDGPLFSNKNNNYSCQAKRLFGVHVNREHSNQLVKPAGRRI